VAAPGVGFGLRSRDPRSGWLVLGFGALAAFLLVTLAAMSWPTFGRLDAVVSAGIRSWRTPALNPVAIAASALGSVYVVLPAALVLAAWMVARRNWRGVIYVVMTVGVGWALGNYVVKNIIRRDRPAGVNIVPLLGDHSMPSSHALAAFLLFTTLCVLIMLNMPVGRHVKRWIAIASALIIIAVGLSRAYLGVHWFGDVVASYLFGGAWWTFTTATYFGSLKDEKRAVRRQIGLDSRKE